MGPKFFLGQRDTFGHGAWLSPWNTYAPTPHICAPIPNLIALNQTVKAYVRVPNNFGDAGVPSPRDEDVADPRNMLLATEEIFATWRWGWNSVWQAGWNWNYAWIEDGYNLCPQYGAWSVCQLIILQKTRLRLKLSVKIPLVSERCTSNQMKQEAQLMLTTGSTRLAVSRGQQTWYHSTCYI